MEGKIPLDENYFKRFAEVIKWFNEKEGIDKTNLDLEKNYELFKQFIKNDRSSSPLGMENALYLFELEEKEGHLVKNMFMLFQIISLIENADDPLINWRIESFEQYLKDMLKSEFEKIERYWRDFKNDVMKFSGFVSKGIEVLGFSFLYYLMPLIGKKE